MSAITSLLYILKLVLDWIKHQTIRATAQKELSDDVLEKQRARVDRAAAAGKLPDDQSGTPDPNDRANG